MKKLILLLAVLGLSLATAQSGPDTYVYQAFGEVDTLDPEGAYDTASGTVLENVYETLYSYQGASITEYEPTLATSYEVSEDGLTYTYTLREGVQFHSGNEMTCRDVEYSIERILVMNDPQSGVWFQAEALLGTGANANDDESITWEMIDNAVECVDDYTVQFNLPAVDPAFFVKLMYTNASIIDSQWAIENGEWDGTEATWRDWVGRDPREGFLHNNVSGTGAYRLVSWDGTNVVAEAFPEYWGGEPEIKTVLIQVVEELATRILALQNGDADRIVLGADSDWATLEAQVRGIPGVAVHEDDFASLSVGAMHLVQDVVTTDNAANVGSGQLDGNGIPADFFADENVRRGFAYSFDPEAFIDEVYLGQGVQLTMALPPTFLGYDESIPVYTFDPEAAEEAFRAAFDGQLWDTGFEMTISYNTGNQIRQTIAEILKANIEDLNPKFKINVRGIQWPDFLNERDNYRLPIAIVGWAPDYADPDNYIHTFYHSDGYYGSLLRFQDEEIDSLVEQARATTDEEERAQLYSQVAQRAHELVPFITYPASQVFMVTRDNLEGVYYNPMLSHYYLWKDISKN
jgi:peptide/nickel transport system substrate-binding protein